MTAQPSQPEPGGRIVNWTGRFRGWGLRTLPPDKLLPETQPSYVASWIYVFGMAAIAALAYVVISGLVLALNGPSWYHVSAFGHFVNSTHLWSVELFFMTMVIHLWGKFWMASWRGGRTLTWITGVLAFVVSIVTAFTGYLLQTNFDSQWIAFQAKDALNAVGVGAWFNVANLGQVLMWHIVLLPLAVGAVVVLHVLLVRVHGVAPPLEAAETDAQLGGSQLSGSQLGGSQLSGMQAADAEAAPRATEGGPA
ncbi:cytochrome b N-terminal domain-containing protein [Sinomonas sp. RB5]